MALVVTVELLVLLAARVVEAETVRLTRQRRLPVETAI
jgi:hypothetical protein